VPVVALETSIWCQGLPYPENVEGARRVMQALEDEGACGAPIALDEGCVRVGMEPKRLEAWCQSQDALKCGVRDLGWVLAEGRRGATTVSACLAICEAAGLEVFVTGGIGGVHRGAGGRDVSSDLAALGNHPVCVVASGAKSILDIDATLERLESLCVALVGCGTDTFPIFYSASSRWPVPVRIDDPARLAATWKASRALGLRASMLVAHPVPEADGLDPMAVEEWVAEAVGEAESRGVAGKALTPFLLAWLHEASGGATLRANLALIESNARLGARIARALH
jgi:pseudouridine-5'-phosphate glycosidase